MQLGTQTPGVTVTWPSKWQVERPGCEPRHSDSRACIAKHWDPPICLSCWPFFLGLQKVPVCLQLSTSVSLGKSTNTPVHPYTAPPHLASKSDPWPGPILPRPCCNLDPEFAFLADSPQRVVLDVLHSYFSVCTYSHLTSSQ